MHYKEKNIKNLDINDINVAISGIIVSKIGNTILLDDGDAQITIISNNDQEFKENAYIRAFGTLIYIDNTLHLQTHFIQDLSNINKNLHKKIKGILSK